MSARFWIYFSIALDRSGFVAYIIEPRDEEAETTRKRRVEAGRRERFFETSRSELLDKNGGRVYTTRCHPTGQRREKSLLRRETFSFRGERSLLGNELPPFFTERFTAALLP
jgi:hypothetical protein